MVELMVILEVIKEVDDGWQIHNLREHVRAILHHG